jgi:DNA polymerase-3 subunit alpha
MLTGQLEDLEGSVEMVAFPKAYEKYSEFWQEDNVVAMSGKIETRRDSLQLVCESVAPYTSIGSGGNTRNGNTTAVITTNDYAFADMSALGFDESGYEEGGPSEDLRWEELSTVAPASLSQPNGSGMLGSSSNGHSTYASSNGASVPHSSSNGHATYTSSNEHATYASSNGATDSSSSSNGHGANTSSNGNGSTMIHADMHGHASNAMNETTNGASVIPEPVKELSTPSTPQAAPQTVMRPRQRIQIARKDEDVRPAAPPPSGPSYHLHITLCRSDNADADIRCMQEVYKVLQRFNGGHQVSLYLPTGECNVILEPMQRINPTPELITSLKEILGESQVMLEGKG